MADAVVFQIEAGQFALEIVDKSEVGYSESWLAPGGKTVDTVTLADYDASSATFMCQVTAGALTATADTTTVDVPATFCSPAKSIPQPAETSYALELSMLQDPQVVAGISAYLFEHDVEEAYFLLGLNDDLPPRAIGRVRLQASTFGGEARTVLTADVTLPCSVKPSILFGTTVTATLGATSSTSTSQPEHATV
jgi:hypothetical protein